MVGKSPFAYRSVDQNALAEPDSVALERQQAVLLKMLLGQQGAAVSFADLQHAGVEFPASVVSELELLGVPLERCALRARGGSTMGVRLDPAWRQSSAPGLATPAPERAIKGQRVEHDRHGAIRARHHRTPRLIAIWLAEVRQTLTAATSSLRDLRLRDLRTNSIPVQRMWSYARNPRLLVPPALLAAVGATVAIVVGQLDTGVRRTPSARVLIRRPYTPSSGSLPVRRGRHTTPMPPPVHEPVSPALAAELQARGHELLETGQYALAARLLRQALAATGERLQACLQPVNEACLAYAYALYDLGRTLTLSGHAAAAVSVLERRLLIENQRQTVAAALEQARVQTG